jgi:hypothetical protein
MARRWRPSNAAGRNAIAFGGDASILNTTLVLNRTPPDARRHHAAALRLVG